MHEHDRSRRLEQLGTKVVDCAVVLISFYDPALDRNIEGFYGVTDKYLFLKQKKHNCDSIFFFF